ncbi:MAG: glutamate-1-semialdehyde 2,1-aminomutase [Saprospiraceae bacterium]
MQSNRSHQLFEKAQRHIPGGVNSPVRAFQAVGGTPIFIKKAKGAYLYDEDGNRYLDLINSWGPMILGHAHPEVVAAVREQLPKSFSFGAPTEAEVQIAELITSTIPHVEMIRFVSSGTEACMSAIRLARGFTKRDYIVKFKGCYHGHADAFLVDAGSGALTQGKPSSEGIPKAFTQYTLSADFNDLGSVNALFEKYPDQIAAVIIEPVAGNMGCIPPEEGFLKSLQDLCKQAGALFILDEVMTGFRLAWGGAAELFSLAPDIVCYGKIIGGGMPVGAFGGRRDIFEHLAPLGGVYQAGTLSGNPVAVAAGLATLNILHGDPTIYQKLESNTRWLADKLRSLFQQQGKAYTVHQCSSMLSIFFSGEPIRDYVSAKTTDTALFARYFHHMLAAGVYLPPSAFESWFVSVEVGERELERIVGETAGFMDL